MMSGSVARHRKRRKSTFKHRKVLGEAIRHYRKRARLTQERLAELANLNPKYIGEVERGEKIISIEALLRIAKASKVHVRIYFRHL